MAHEEHELAEVSSTESDSEYRSVEQLWSGEPNQALVAYFSGETTPGTALDIGCGEGADVVWLAQNGWDVVGIDFAETAVERAKKRIADAGVTAEVLQRSFTEFARESQRTFDLVTCCYGQILANEESIEQLKSLVAPQGTLFIVHHNLQSDTIALPEWIAKNLSAEFTVVKLERFERDVRSGAGAHHKDDVVLKAVRD